MGQTVYVDLFFMINFSMDFLCFFLASQLMGSKMSVFRTLVAAAVGGVYANVSLFLGMVGIPEILLDICVCSLMCLIAFGRCRRIILHTLVYIAVSMTLGGFMTALFELLNRAELPLDTVEGDGISAYLLALLAIISAALTLAGGRFFRRKTSKKYTCVCISMNNARKTLKAFCDSGNMLRDPVSGKPCIVADVNSLRGILPPRVLDIARNKRTEELIGLDRETARRVKLIPTTTAIGDGLIIAFRPDGIRIGEGDGTTELDALIALCELGKTADGCEALVPSEILT